MQKDIKTLFHTLTEMFSDVYYFISRGILLTGDEPVKMVPTKNPVSQETYFRTHIRWIKNAEIRILIFGYDPFIAREESIQEITKAVNGQDYGRTNIVDVSAIIPISQDCAELEKLANETRFTLLRTPRELDMGFIVYDNKNVTTWDSTKPTDFLPEAESGAPYRRRFEYSFYIAHRLAKVFDEHIREYIPKAQRDPLKILRVEK